MCTQRNRKRDRTRERSSVRAKVECLLVDESFYRVKKGEKIRTEIPSKTELGRGSAGVENETSIARCEGERQRKNTSREYGHSFGIDSRNRCDSAFAISARRAWIARFALRAERLSKICQPEHRSFEADARARTYERKSGTFTATVLEIRRIGRCGKKKKRDRAMRRGAVAAEAAMP